MSIWIEPSPRLAQSFPPRPCDPEALALLHFTSGTTGNMHVHQAVLYHAYSGRMALDLQPGDIFWCTADPGWVTGTSYGIISPLCNRVTLIIDEQEFEAEHWYQLLEQQRINVWYTAPTAIRMLMKAGADLAQGHDLSALRFMASVGEPLNSEAVLWGQRVFGIPFHDNWWQSETGGIMIANFAAQPVYPGSMGRPLPGIEAAIVQRPPDGHLNRVTLPGIIGELALKPGISADEALQAALMAHARKRLGPAVAPREIAFRHNLPKTRSGKIMRRLLRARELGLPEGDLSTLESDEA